MAWSLGEDSYDWSHIRQMAAELAKRGGQTPPSGPAPVEAPVVPLSPVEVEAPQPEEAPVQVEVPPVEQAPVEPEAPVQEEAPVGIPAPTKDDLPFDPSVFENPRFVSPHEEGDPDLPYNVVWVDGTEEGPEGDHSEEPGSPPDFSIFVDGEGPQGQGSIDLQEETGLGTERINDAAEEQIQPIASSEPVQVAEHIEPTEPVEAIEPIDSTLEEFNWPNSKVVEPLDEEISQEEADATWARPLDRSGFVGVGRLNPVFARPVGAANGHQRADSEEYGFRRSCRVRRMKRAKRV